MEGKEMRKVSNRTFVIINRTLVIIKFATLALCLVFICSFLFFFIGHTIGKEVLLGINIKPSLIVPISLISGIGSFIVTVIAGITLEERTNAKTDRTENQRGCCPCS